MNNQRAKWKIITIIKCDMIYENFDLFSRKKSFKINLKTQHDSKN
jgi:hypothetical protein